MIKPTIGRRVWYWAHSDQVSPYDAGIAFVENDNTLNISYADHTGMMHAEIGVYLWQGEGARPTGPYCEWMPYQLGQAAKALSA